MPLDLRSLDNNTLLEADLCIIGGGAAGITLAREFIGQDIKILLLESGGFEFEDETQALYEGEQASKKRARSIEDGVHYGVTLHDSRLRYFGGTTNHWGGWCAPLTPLDFGRRDWVPHSGWPISYNDLLPYYQRARNTCEIGKGPFGGNLWAGQQEKPYAFNTKKVIPRFYRFSPPTRFGERYGQELEDAQNITVVLNANVTQLNLNESASAIESVDIKSLNDKNGKISAGRFVLACGGIENARILLLSNKVMSVGVGNQNDLVGRFFMDHLMDNVGYFMVTDTPDRLEKLYEQFTPRGKHTPVQAAFCPSAEMQNLKEILNIGVVLEDAQREPTSGVTALYKLIGNHKQNKDVEFLNDDFLGVLSDLDDAVPVAIRHLRGKRPRYLSRFLGGSEQAPNPLSRVMLSAEKDALGKNRVLLDWRLTELDKKTFSVMAKTLAAEFGRLGIGRVQAAPWFDGSEEDFLGQDFSRELEAARHHSGTTRMSNDPKTGVVDKNCKVHGVANLYIAGSSLFPTIGYSSPTYTIVALAHRLADHLKYI